MRLTEQQLNYYHTFGFLIFRQYLSPDEMRRYDQEFEAALDKSLGGRPHEGVKRHLVRLMNGTSPYIASMIDDPRLADVAEQLIGKKVLGAGIEANYYVGDTQWHPDNVDHPYTAIKFTFYLDPMRADNGALRVIPGSHLDPFHSLIARDPRVAFGVEPDAVPAYVFESQPGDVLVFNQRVWHAAFHGSNHRRMGAFVFFEDPDTPEATNALRDSLRSEIQRHYQTTPNWPFYDDYWRAMPDPRHQGWVRRMEELGIFDVPVGRA